MINDSIKATGALKIVLKDSSGNTKFSADIKNLVVDIGKVIVARRLMNDASIPFPNKMGVGTGTAAPLANNVGLGTPLSYVDTENTNVGHVAVPGQYNNITRFAGIYGPGVATGAITEAALFSDNGSTKTMLSRTTFSVVNKTAADTLFINWDITIN